MQEKPLCYLDLETTGTDPVKDRIVSIAALVERAGEDVWLDELVNPGVSIPEAASSIHGITDAMVKDKPLFKDIAPNIMAFFDGCDFCGYNLLNYDLPLLWSEFHRAGLVFDLSGRNVIDACVIFRVMEPRDLTAAMKFYCDLDHKDAHGARADVEATRKVFKGQWARYDKLQALSRGGLSEFCRKDRRVDLAGTIVLNDKGEPCYTAKRVRGVRVIDDPGFGQWMLKNDFSEETKMHLRRIFGAKK